LIQHRQKQICGSAFFIHHQTSAYCKPNLPVYSPVQQAILKEHCCHHSTFSLKGKYKIALIHMPAPVQLMMHWNNATQRLFALTGRLLFAADALQSFHQL